LLIAGRYILACALMRRRDWSSKWRDVFRYSKVHPGNTKFIISYLLASSAATQIIWNAQRLMVKTRHMLHKELEVSTSTSCPLGSRTEAVMVSCPFHATAIGFSCSNEALTRVQVVSRGLQRGTKKLFCGAPSHDQGDKILCACNVVIRGLSDGNSRAGMIRHQGHALLVYKETENQVLRNRSVSSAYYASINFSSALSSSPPPDVGFFVGFRP